MINTAANPSERLQAHCLEPFIAFVRRQTRQFAIQYGASALIGG